MKQNVTIVITPEVRRALDRVASQSDRSRSWVVESLLREGLVARDVLPAVRAEETAQ